MEEDEKIILENFEGDGESAIVSLKALTTPVENVVIEEIMGKVRERSYL